MLLVVDVPVHAVAMVHVYVYGPVPPEVVVEQVNALPTVAVLQLGAVVTTGWPVTETVVAADALLTLLPSLATTLIV